MKKPPAFQFYAADYLADENVALMSLEEEGAYIRAIAYCWREGSIPADPARLSPLLKGACIEVVRVVQGCFKQSPIDASRLIHPRLDFERDRQREWREKSRLGGKKSGESRRMNILHSEPPLNGASTKTEGWLENA